MGWRKEGFNTDFPEILVCFPSILLARGKSWGRDLIPEHVTVRSLFGQGLSLGLHLLEQTCCDPTGREN